MTSRAQSVRCRFAPAPTGALHLGSAHTAAFNWLFAKRNRGQFLVRIDDSDPERSSNRAIQGILEDLEWLGFESDEPVVRQSEHFNDGTYLRAIQKLRDKDLIYDDPEGSGAIFYRPAEKSLVVEDLLRDPIVFSQDDVGFGHLREVVIVRDSGWPVYNFASVVDDILMGITHVIRGDDLLVQTPMQISLFRALDAKAPVFAHLPQILDPDGKKYSKRWGAKPISAYREEGYLPSAVVNYLALLGGSLPQELDSGREFFQVEQIVELFDIERGNISPARVDERKMIYINAMHFRELPLETLVDFVKVFLSKNGQEAPCNGWVERYCEEYRPRARTIRELESFISLYLADDIVYDKAIFVRYLLFDGSSAILKGAIHLLEERNEIDPQMEGELRSLAELQGVPFKDAAQCLRVALVGSDRTPNLISVFWLLGRRKCLVRLRESLRIVSSIPSEWLAVMSGADLHLKELLECIRHLIDIARDKSLSDDVELLRQLNQGVGWVSRLNAMLLDLSYEVLSGATERSPKREE